MNTEKLLFGLISLAFSTMAFAGPLTGSHSDGVPPAGSAHPTVSATPVTEMDKDARVYHILTELRFLRKAAVYEGVDGEKQRQKDNKLCAEVQKRMDDIWKQVEALSVPNTSVPLAGHEKEVRDLEDESSALSYQKERCREYRREKQLAQEVAELRGIGADLAQEGIDKSLALGLDNADKRENLAREGGLLNLSRDVGAVSLVLGQRFTRQVLADASKRIDLYKSLLSEGQKKSELLAGEIQATQQKVDHRWRIFSRKLRHQLDVLKRTKAIEDRGVKENESEVAAYTRLQSFVQAHLTK